MSAFLAYTWDLIVRGGSAAAGFLGGMNARSNGGLTLLLLLMAADYVTGVIAAALGRSKHAEHGGLSSAAGWRGLLRKALTMLVVLLSVLLDRFVNQGNAMFQSAVTWFYISNESISLVENLARCGVPIPRKLRAMLEQMRREDDPPPRGSAGGDNVNASPRASDIAPIPEGDSPQRGDAVRDENTIPTFARNMRKRWKRIATKRGSKEQTLSSSTTSEPFAEDHSTKASSVAAKPRRLHGNASDLSPQNESNAFSDDTVSPPSTQISNESAFEMPPCDDPCALFRPPAHRQHMRRSTNRRV